MPAATGAVEIGGASAVTGSPRDGDGGFTALTILREIVERHAGANEALAAVVRGEDPYTTPAFRERLMRHFTAARNAALGQAR